MRSWRRKSSVRCLGELDGKMAGTVAVEAFLQGCSNKKAALYTMDRDPDTIEDYGPGHGISKESGL